ncbi:MAG: PLP-dependent lyase/thiolase [Actinomycetota bacterium]|nr:PLP-dependent lyase/thiolase [Actinomycetota bacterium]
MCRATVDVATPHPFVCPVATPADRHHALHPLQVGVEEEVLDDANPFVTYGPRLAWWAFARAHGMTEGACTALTRDVAAGFAVTPFTHDTTLTDRLGADVWIKDETANIGGSHKGRHLVTILLHLRAAEALRLGPVGGRRPLAIASCGNAAIAAATLAQRSEWPLRVFVPEWASPDALTRIEDLGASITACPRLPGDAPGDPALLRLREAVAAGAVPFSVQGPENALCLDGGRTIGWEISDALCAAGERPLDRAVVQVGGGAFATCMGWGLGTDVRLDAMQTAGCAPLARAWRRAAELGLGPGDVASRWDELMTPWNDPYSVADGILDDETYDWLGVFAVMARSGGHPLVAPESAVEEAHELARSTGIDVSTTGSAGLAGLLLADGAPAPGERVAVVFSGVAR